MGKFVEPHPFDVVMVYRQTAFIKIFQTDEPNEKRFILDTLETWLDTYV
jgi:hypothetical protein